MVGARNEVKNRMEEVPKRPTLGGTRGPKSQSLVSWDGPLSGTTVQCS